MATWVFSMIAKTNNNPPIRSNGKKVKYSLEQAMKAKRGSRCIALLLL
jgi:hypothetical protein